MRKFLTTLSTVALACALAAPVFAGANSSKGTKAQQVTTAAAVHNKRTKSVKAAKTQAANAAVHSKRTKSLKAAKTQGTSATPAKSAKINSQTKHATKHSAKKGTKMGQPEKNPAPAKQ